MNNEFETKFSELQADMVSICLEYVEGRTDMIFIHCLCEPSHYEPEYFYCINKKTIMRHKLNETLNDIDEPKYNVSSERQSIVLDILMKDMYAIRDLCKKYDKEMPTDIKLIYDVKKNKLTAEYKYDLQFTNTDDISATNIFDNWFDEIKDNYDNIKS